MATKANTTIVMTSTTREILKQWAADNLTNLSAEIERCVRERRAREQQQEAAVVG